MITAALLRVVGDDELVDSEFLEHWFCEMRRCHALGCRFDFLRQRLDLVSQISHRVFCICQLSLQLAICESGNRNMLFLARGLVSFVGAAEFRGDAVYCYAVTEPLRVEVQDVPTGSLRLCVCWITCVWAAVLRLVHSRYADCTAGLVAADAPCVIASLLMSVRNVVVSVLVGGSSVLGGFRFGSFLLPKTRFSAPKNGLWPGMVVMQGMAQFFFAIYDIFVEALEAVDSKNSTFLNA